MSNLIDPTNNKSKQVNGLSKDTLQALLESERISKDQSAKIFLMLRKRQKI